MESLAYKLKDKFAKVIAFFHSNKFLSIWDKVMKVLGNIVPKIAIYAILIAFSYIFMSPILRVIVDSVKTKSDITNPDVVWIPTSLTFQNYKDAASALWISRVDTSMDDAWMSTLLNSAFFSLFAAVFQTFVSCITGYAFARFSFKGKKIWFLGLILGFVLPIQLLTLPRSMMLIKLMNKTSTPSTFFGIQTTASNSALITKLDAIFSFVTTTPVLLITLLGQGLNSSILTFIAFSFFKMIPIALDEAAQIDGANFFQIFWHIVIKMSVPTILVIFLFAFIWNWNDTYQLSHLTSLAGNNIAFKSLPKALDGFNRVVSQGSQMSGISTQDQESNNAGLKSAAIVIAIAPLLVLYAFTQRKFVEGIENTGVTGV